MTRSGPSSENERGRRDDGVTIPLMAVVVAVLMTFTAFGVDIARHSGRNREMQRTADTAALDASRSIDGRTTSVLQPIVEAEAAETATRNGDGDADLEVILGWVGVTPVPGSPLAGDKVFYASGPDDVPNAVLVRALDEVDYYFNPSSNDAVRLAAAINGDIPPAPPCDPLTDPDCGPLCVDTDGICDPPNPDPCDPATAPDGCCPDPAGCADSDDDPSCDPADPACQPSEAAGFFIGSSLASVDSNDSALLSGILEQGVGDANPANGSISVALASWQGLAAAQITFDQLATQLGFSGFTPSELVAAGPFTARNIFIASAGALQNQGDTANANVLNAIAANMNGASTVDLGDMFTFAEGGDDAALATNLNVAQLLIGSVFLADGNNSVAVPNATLGIPNLSNSTLTLTMTQAPQWAFGPEGSTATTAQINTGLTSNVNLNSLIPPITGVSSVNAPGTISLNVTGGGATGTSTDIECASPKALTVGVTTNGVSSTFSTTLNVTVNAIGFPVVTDTMAANGSLATPIGGGSLGFAYPTEFDIDPYYAGPKSLGSHGLGLETMSLTVTNPLTGGLIGGLLADTQAAIVGTALPALLDSLDANLIQFVSEQLGASLGSADVWAESLVCNPPQLVI